MEKIISNKERKHNSFFALLLNIIIMEEIMYSKGRKHCCFHRTSSLYGSKTSHKYILKKKISKHYSDSMICSKIQQL